jgi:hypothetical protein
MVPDHNAQVPPDAIADLDALSPDQRAEPMTAPRQIEVPQDRQTLVEMLEQASELEHALCVQYLYAGFTLKAGGDPGVSASQAALTQQWGRQITRVAVQEMYHLMLASNLLTAVGATPNLWRPNFPQLDTRYSDIDLPSMLAPFELETVSRFMCWEKPDQSGWWDGFCEERGRRVRERIGGTGEPPPYGSIGQLYEMIRQGLLAHRDWIDPKYAPRQVTTELFPFRPAFGPVTTPEEAAACIDVIIEEGEGTPDWDSHSHFAYYHQIVNQLQGLEKQHAGFAAGWPSVENPVYDPAHAGPGTALIEDPSAQPVGQAFNDLYRLLCDVLARLFMPHGETPAERIALANAAMALMPIGIRPLGVLLTRLPAGSAYPDRFAGPSFELPDALDPPAGSKQETFAGFFESLRAVAQRCRMLALEDTGLQPGARAALAAVAARLEALLPMLEVS